MVKFINFLLYSNIFIATCALSMTAQTLFILDKDLFFSLPLYGIVFFSTLVIYALHRLVSLKKVDKSLNVKRFIIIEEYKTHIQVYAVLSVTGGAICFFFLNTNTQIALVIPALLSLGYVIPFLGNNKLRLRDLNFVKIFLIAIVWTYVTVLLPFMETGIQPDIQYAFMLLERCLFVFLITLPFDLRDREIDKRNNVMTIPAKIGVQNTLYLSVIVLLLWIVLIWFIYPVNTALALSVSGLSTGFFVYHSPDQKHDYYFTALIDGTMIIQFMLVLLFSFF
jgi:4-hydroxybenzoate polyprenyltransferase